MTMKFIMSVYDLVVENWLEQFMQGRFRQSLGLTAILKFGFSNKKKSQKQSFF